MSYTKLMYHIVFSTKNRMATLKQEHLPRIREYIGGIIRSMGGQMLAANGPPDHLHIAAIGPPTIDVSNFVKTIKDNSSKWMHQTVPDLEYLYWQDDYAAFTVSPSALPRLIAYIANQQEHHRKVDFKQELIALLRRHGVPYEEGYLWR